jgi:hypothetical protein
MLLRISLSVVSSSSSSSSSISRSSPLIDLGHGGLTGRVFGGGRPRFFRIRSLLGHLNRSFLFCRPLAVFLDPSVCLPWFLAVWVTLV